MQIEAFNNIVRGQLAKCEALLIQKGEEYAPQTTETTAAHFDRLAHFKKAAALMQRPDKEALFGMLAKHIISLADMCCSTEQFTLSRWSEKITDSMNYLILLRALVEEETLTNGQN